MGWDAIAAPILKYLTQVTSELFQTLLKPQSLEPTGHFWIPMWRYCV